LTRILVCDAMPPAVSAASGRFSAKCRAESYFCSLLLVKTDADERESR
jgi:hypothetical protein